MAIATTALVPGCGAGSVDGVAGEDGSELMSLDESEDVGSIELAAMSCSNLDGTNAAMAAFAVAVGKELGRWQVGKDFVLVKTNGQTENSTGVAESIKLTTGTDASGPKGKSRCSDGRCANVQAILDMQYDQASGKIWFQGSGSNKVQLNPSALRSRMSAKFKEQQACDSNAKDGQPTACPKEEHKLTYVKAAAGGCDTMFTFNVKRTDGTALKYPGQLKQKLQFADWTNPYVQFTPLANGDIMVDPTGGLNPDGTTSTGSCAAVCTKVSTSSVAGQCCSCGGVNKTFSQSTFNTNVFLCQ